MKPPLDDNSSSCLYILKGSILIKVLLVAMGTRLISPPTIPSANASKPICFTGKTCAKLVLILASITIEELRAR